MYRCTDVGLFANSRPYIMAVAPTSGDTPYGNEQFALRADRLTVPMLITAGRNDGMGGLVGWCKLKHLNPKP